MSAEQNKEVMRKFVKATDRASQEVFLGQGFVLHQDHSTKDKDEFLQHLAYFHTVFSDTYFTVEEQVAEGDVVVTRGIWGGIHSGDFQGLSPTGKQIAINAVLIDRIKDGKIIEHRSLFDMLAMMQQLGIVPSPQASS